LLPTYNHLLLDRHGPVLVVTLNRPERLNAITHVMHDEIVDALRTLDADDESKVIVITGAGRGFCAGGDMSGMPGAGAPDEYWTRENARIFQHERRLIEAFLWAEKPVIAMVNGPASGLGATLALFCDIVVASDQAPRSTCSPASASRRKRHIVLGSLATSSQPISSGRSHLGSRRRSPRSQRSRCERRKRRSTAS
jgi:enoyl-CoA hydratase/carnithine racemase